MTYYLPSGNSFNTCIPSGYINHLVYSQGNWQRSSSLVPRELARYKQRAPLQQVPVLWLLPLGQHLIFRAKAWPAWEREPTYFTFVCHEGLVWCMLGKNFQNVLCIPVPSFLHVFQKLLWLRVTLCCCCFCLASCDIYISIHLSIYISIYLYIYIYTLLAYRMAWNSVPGH